MPAGAPARDEPGAPFPRELLAGDTLDAARALLGARLVREVPGEAPRVGRIVEVEAYIGLADQASHARMGPTPRNAVMFGPPGIAYVYLVYGMYHCLNVVTEPAPRPAAVLVRAVEPLAGIEAMRAARISRVRRKSVATDRRAVGRYGSHVVMESAARLAAGPGKLADAFSIDRSHTGIDLCNRWSSLRLEARPSDEPVPDVVETPRIGIAYAGEPWISKPWRLAIRDNPAVSRTR